MPKTLDPGVVINVSKNAFGEYHPTLSNFQATAAKGAVGFAKITIQFDVEINEFITAPGGKTYTDAEWSALADKIVHFGFTTGSTLVIDSTANLTFLISDKNPTDKRLEISSEFDITNGKIGGAN